jgi:putative ABC transport system permease protein
VSEGQAPSELGAPVDRRKHTPAVADTGWRYHLRFIPMLAYLYRTRARRQPLQEALAVFGIAIGVALIFAVEIANTSVPASVRSLYHQLAGKASLEVGARSPEGFGQSLEGKIAEAPGVFGAAGILDSRVTVTGPRGKVAVTLFGAQPAIGAIGGPLAHRISLSELEKVTPAAVRESLLAKRLQGAQIQTVVLPEGPARAIGAAPGQLVLIETRGRSSVAFCARVLGPQVAGPAAQSPVAISTLSAAQAITGLQGRLTRVMVMPQSGQLALARRSLSATFGSTLNVRSSASEVKLLENATNSSNEVAALFTGLSVVVGLLFAYNALLLSLAARRRYVVRLRNLGAYRHELVGLVAFEVLILAGAGSLLGLVLGDLLSEAAFSEVPHYLASGFPISAQHVLTAKAALTATAGGVLATIVAAVIPTVVALRAKPFEEEAASTRAASSLGPGLGKVGIAVGGLAVVSTIAIALLDPESSLIAVAALAVGLVFLLAPTVPWLIDRARSVATRLPYPSVYVATNELRAAPSRAIAIAATSAIAVYAIVAIGGSLNDIQRGAIKTTENVAGGAGLFIYPSPFKDNPFPVQPFAATEALKRIRALSAVARVDALRGSFLDAGDRRLVVLVKPTTESEPVSASQIVEGSRANASKRLRESGWVALSSTVARADHLKIGDPLVLPTPAGYATFRLAATITNYGWPPGALLMSAHDFVRLWKTEAVTALRVFLKPGVTEEKGLLVVRRALSGLALTATTKSEAESDITSVTDQGVSQLAEIADLVLLAATLAVIAAMSGSIWQRRPRLSSLKRLGMSWGALLGMILFETALVVIFGCALGALFGLAGQPIATSYIRLSTGFPELYAPAMLLALRTFLITILLALTVTGALGTIVARRTRL